jgi:type IV secretion system protein VirD4
MFDILTSVFSGFFSILSELLTLLSGGSQHKRGYTAAFAKETSLLSLWNKGFCLNGYRKLTRKDSFKNALIVGGSGSGKSQSVLIPDILTTNASIVVNDVSGELFAKTSGALRARGYDVKVLHFSNPEISAGFNPVQLAETSSQIHKLASMLARTANSGAKADPFWESQSASLIAVFIGILKTQSREYQHIRNVLLLINRMTEKTHEGKSNSVDLLFTRYASEELYSEYKTFLAYDDKLLTSIVASAKSALSIFNDAAVARVTAENTIDFADVRKRKTAIFIQNSVADQQYFSTISAIFFESLVGYILSRFPKDGEMDIHLLLDEFSALGRIPVMPAAFANVRKHNAAIMAVVQSTSQLESAYGKNDACAIQSNCFAKVFFGGAPVDETKKLEQTLGLCSYKTADGRTETRPLLTSDEIRMLKPNRALIIAGMHPPILAKMHPAYTSRLYASRLKLPPAILTGAVPATVPLLQLNRV